MQEFYYHCTSAFLETGAIIKPGNWGRILSLYGGSQTGDWAILYREQCLEHVRKLEFPEKPSRMSSVFLSRTLKELQFFKDKSNRKFDVAYKVMVIDSAAHIHLANWNAVNPATWGQQHSIIKSMDECARSYWSNSSLDHGDFTECLAASPIQVIESCP